jgi:uncharacterized protein YrrD
MLWNASAINGYVIAARDGSLGSVNDLLFDDTGWAVRWLVVDTGNWLPGRKVLLPASALAAPDRELRQFPVELTQQQVKDSPDVDTDLPVSRQSEAHLYDHYEFEPYWDGSFSPTSLVMAVPLGAPMNLPYSEPRDPVDSHPPYKGDPHLRSVNAVTGYGIHASDGEIGTVEDILVDDAGWKIRYFTVDTGNWWPGERVLVSPGTVRKIDWVAKQIYLNTDRETVRKSLPYDPAITVDGAYDQKLAEYYGPFIMPM